MVIAGLTGGIACGKSTVSGFLSNAGAKIIDADQIAREVVHPGMSAYEEILSSFGPSIVCPDGSIDRKRLGTIVFEDREKRQRLNTIVHPHVLERSQEMISRIAAQTPEAIVIKDIPLLFEAGMEKDLKEIIVVYIPENLQLERLMKRDGIGEKAAMVRIGSQMPIEEKRKKATIVIDNCGSVEKTKQLALAALDRLRKLKQ